VTANGVPAGVVDVIDEARQQIVIDVRGPDVLNISGNVENPEDPDAVMPDWVQLMAAAANFGMMSGVARRPWASRAEVARKVFDAATAHMQWVVAVEHVDPGFFLVARTVLDARQLDEVSLWTMNAPIDAPRIEIARLSYPGPSREALFEIRRERPLRTTRDRLVQIEFAQTPAAELQERVASAVDTWGQLLILGGYAPAARHPRLVHTLPDLPYWSDEVTFVQPFAEFFESDDACFDAIVNCAARLQHDGAAVRAVTIL
jgi:hypothetical protein